jgi:hypothetical protein
MGTSGPEAGSGISVCCGVSGWLSRDVVNASRDLDEARERRAACSLPRTRPARSLSHVVRTLLGAEHFVPAVPAKGEAPA